MARALVVAVLFFGLLGAVAVQAAAAGDGAQAPAAVLGAGRGRLQGGALNADQSQVCERVLRCAGTAPLL